MTNNFTNNKRIAKNTLLLYFRMFITMAVGLYTSRVILNVLGVSDYGIYNVVGGVITIVSFLNIAMTQASQRFMSFEMGNGSVETLNKVFCTSINIHLLISIIAVIIGETIGLWFVNEKLNLPANRMVAVNWVYQASILTFVISVMSVPYNSAIVAHEKMSAFAYISILEVILKLLIVFLLFVIPFDKLIVYSILLVAVMAFIRLCYTIYCKKHFEECTYHYMIDRKLSKEMFSFAGWSMFGNLGFSFKDQISNIILNLFYGTTLNAARGIGVHVGVLINSFATNFTMAINPQITKQFAAGDIEASRKLVYAGSRYSFYLLSLISIPLIINIDYILKLWLGLVPEFTAPFVIFTLLTSLLYTLSGCVTTAIQATGKIKWFQIGICIIMLSELPVAWILLRLGYPPYSVMWPSVITYLLALVFRFWLINRYVPGYYFREYLLEVVLRCLLLFCLCYFLSVLVCTKLTETFSHFILSVIFSALISGSVFYIFGTNRSERLLLTAKLKKVYGKNYCR